MQREWVVQRDDVPAETKGFLFILTIFVVFCTVSVIVQFTPAWTDKVVKGPNNAINGLSAEIKMQQIEIDELQTFPPPCRSVNASGTIFTFGNIPPGSVLVRDYGARKRASIRDSSRGAKKYG